ncbi:hypothetical protein [Occallatibacter riparius]|uniref:Uncharacterized protein n=1 Tax=Occallatibacter riparius TaxID=1002689 RepID=A0A9J7BUM5_9BACT|nr:hypothetical protein [Occallatibacter riparius]UWZ86367.1 hypothetical protein MOP44_10585 [Occallatibacter riparius]
MRYRLVFVLSSRRSQTEEIARRQISTLVNFGDGIVCPDKWGTFEPLKTPFNAEDIDIPVQGLSKPQGNFHYRKGKPVQLSGEIYNRTHPSTARFPSPLFTNYWVGRFEGKWVDRVGIRTVRECVSEMFMVSGADFGFLTTEADMEAKNQRKPVMSYQGLTLDSGIPGMYWINFFSEGLAKWLGIDSFPKRLAASKQLAGSGVLLEFCESPGECRDIEAIQRQRTAIEWLGPEKFFDIRFPNRSATLPWESIPIPDILSSD